MSSEAGFYDFYANGTLLAEALIGFRCVVTFPLSRDYFCPRRLKYPAFVILHSCEYKPK